MPRAVKRYVEEQVAEFGRAKLGLELHPQERKRRERQAAEEWALRQLALHARDLDLFSGRRGPVRPPTGNGRPERPRGVRIHGFRFPVRERRPRVNLGEEISGFSLVPFNHTDDPISGVVDAFMLYGDTAVLHLLEKETVQIPPHGTAMALGPITIGFSDDVFAEKGEYRLRVRLLDDRGYPIDEQTRRIFVEHDPGFRSPFEVTPEDFSGFPEHLRTLQWRKEGYMGNDPILYFNVKHPAYERFEEQDSMGDYLFGIFLEGALAFVLDRPLASDDGDANYHPLDSGSINAGPSTAYEEVVAKIAEIRSRFYEGS